MSKSQELLESLNNLKSSVTEKSTIEQLTGKVIPVASNFLHDKYCDRLYMGYNNIPRVVQADGSLYQGKINSRSRSKQRIDGTGSFKQRLWVTDDGRWFDNAGIPIEKPTETGTDTDTEVDTD